MLSKERYGFFDRLFHDLAFSMGQAQRALADVEDIAYRTRLRRIRVDLPVFITALPRSGTTILLRLLAESGRFATHRYRDMPFILCPLLWHRFSRRFAANAEPTERAHGDGISISADSPEAFEEMIWKVFWPEHYQPDRILPWMPGEENEEFEEFLESHMRKVIELRRGGLSDEMRYASKNNLNICRLASLPRPLRGGLMLVPFRDPLQQAASMLLQHKRFTEIQRVDPFVRRYMEAIGHHEFGVGLRPVDFGGWLDSAPSPEGLEFWVRYWNAAYRHVLANAGESTKIVSYANLTHDPRNGLKRLADVLSVPRSLLSGLTDRLGPPRAHNTGPEAVGTAVLEEATEIHLELQAAAVV